MKVFSEHTGPMAFWPEVAAVEGIQEILPILKQKYKIILISNARDSDQNLVREALERVKLASYFDAIFTPYELNEHKPAPRFYLNVLKQIEIEPENAIMIGDDYENDIIAAKQVGLRTIWFNASRQNFYSNVFPYHDAMVNDPGDIISILEQKLSVY